MDTAGVFLGFWETVILCRNDYRYCTVKDLPASRSDVSSHNSDDTHTSRTSR